MSRWAPRRSSGVLVALVLACVAAPAALAGKAIGPDQSFEANVNGQPAGAVVHVACGAGATVGNPLPGQYVQVKRAKVVPDYEPGPFGFTGDATSIVVIAQFGSPIAASSASGAPNIPVLVVANLTKYGKKAKLPRTVSLPCTGTGTFAFRPLDGSGVTAFVKVTYEP